MLTVVEYTLLLYRALLPAPVWYRFFLNKEYGSLFSSLITGLYLTFKLTSVVEKVILLCSKLLYWKIMFYFVALELDLYVILFRFFSGPILFCFHKGIITERYPLWVARNIGTGMEPNLTKWF